MELRQLATFHMVAATLSFSRTAQALNYVQSSVTAQIQSLEEELGTRLFDRLGKRVALTDAGKRLLPYAEKMLDLAEEARTTVTGGEVPTGSLTITAPETICTYRLPAVLREFHKRFPQVKLLFRPSLSLDIRRCVSEGSIDVAFVIDEPLHSNALMIEPLVTEPLLLLAAPGHCLAQRSSLRVRDLEEEQFLLTEIGCTYRNILERVLNQEGVHITTNLEFGSVESIKQCTIAAMGMTFLPAITVERELEEQSLVALSWEGQEFSVVTQMLWHKDKWLSPALQAFLTVAREVLQSSQDDAGAIVALEAI